MANGQLKYKLIDATHLAWTVPDGQPDLVLDMGKVHANNVRWAAVHGFKRRVADGAALSADTATGKSATWADKRAAMQEIITHLESGSDQWNLRASRAPRQDNEFEFYMQCLQIVYTGKTVEGLTKFAKGKSRAERQAHLQGSSAMKEAAELVGLQMAEGIDTDALEAELDSIE